MIDRERLRDALNKLGSLNQKSCQRLFTWNGLEHELLDAAAIYVNGADLVNFPLAATDVSNLMAKFTDEESSLPAAAVRKCCLVDASDLMLIPKGSKQKRLLQDLICRTLQRMLDIDFESLRFDVAAELEKLVICSGGESHRTGVGSLDKPGKFGTLLLQVPIQDETFAGRLVIHNGTNETIADFGSNGPCLVAAVVGACSNERKAAFSIQSHPRGKTAVIIFSLKWNDHTILGQRNVIPACIFPDFIILTNEIKKALTSWKIKESGALMHPQNDTGNEKAMFLCVPISDYRQSATVDDDDNGYTKTNLATTGFNLEDLIMLKSLSNITFIDVHTKSNLWIDLVYGPGEGESRWVHREPSSAKIHGKHSSDTILDDIFKQRVDTARNVVWAEASGISKATAVAVIRPRNLHYITISEPNSHGKSALELFLESLELQAKYPAAADNPYVIKSHIKELQQIVEVLKSEVGVDAIACKRCFSTILLDVCFQLDERDVAEVILKDVLKQLIVKLPCLPKRRPAHSCRETTSVSYANFIYFVNGWDRHAKVVKQLVNQLISIKDICLITEIALNFLAKDYLIGARATFECILKAVTNTSSKLEDIWDMFDPRWFTLALRLHEDEPNQQVSDVLLITARCLKPSQLAELIEHLGKLFRDKSLECNLFLKELANIVGSSFNKFTSKEFFKIVDTCSLLGDSDVIDILFKNLGFGLIETTHSDDERLNSLWTILNESISTQAHDAIVASLTGSDGLKGALTGFLFKLKHHDGVFDVSNIIRYVDCLQSLEDPVQLSTKDITDHLSLFFWFLNKDVLFPLASSLFKERFHAIHRKPSIARRTFETLVQHIQFQVRNDPSAMLSLPGLNGMFTTLAWFGDIEFVKLLLDQHKEESRLLVVRATLRSEFNGSDAASSLYFSRDVFYHLLLEYIREMKKLSHKRRTTECSTCFGLMAKSERTFGQVAPDYVILEWTALANSFSFDESVQIAGRVMLLNASYFEAPGSNKAPSSLKVFQELCKTALVKWTPETTTSNLCHLDITLFSECFFRFGEKKEIDAFCRFLSDLQHTVNEFSDIHKVVVHNQVIVDLAMRSAGAALAFNELIDTRLRILKEQLTCPTTTTASIGQNQPRLTGVETWNFEQTNRNTDGQCCEVYDLYRMKTKILPVTLGRNANAPWGT